jgi:hypothetical protein
MVVAAALLWRAAGEIPVVPVPGQLGPDFWPRLALAGLALSSAIKAVQRWRETGQAAVEREVAPDVDLVTLAGATALLFAYVASVPYVGFAFGTVLFLALFMAVGGLRRPIPLLATAVGASLVLLVVFVKVVYLPLPRGTGPFADATLALYRVLGLF